MGQACSCHSEDATAEPPTLASSTPAIPSSAYSSSSPPAANKLNTASSRLSSSPAALSKQHLHSSQSADDVATILEDHPQHDMTKDSLALHSSKHTSPTSSPAPLDRCFATTLSPLPSADDSSLMAASAGVSVNPISTTQQMYSSTRLTISSAAAESSNAVLPVITTDPSNDLRRHVSLGSNHIATLDDNDSSVDDDLAVAATLARRLGRQDSLDGDGYVEVAEDIVDVTDCLDSLDLSLDTDAPQTTMAYNIRITPTAGDDPTVADRGGSVSLATHGSVTQQRLQMAIPAGTPSPSPRMTPSPSHSQGSASGSLDGTPEGNKRVLSEFSGSIADSVVLPAATTVLGSGSGSSSSFSPSSSPSGAVPSLTSSTSLSASTSAASVPLPVVPNRTSSGSYSSDFLMVPPLDNIPYIHPSAPPVSSSPPPTSPFLSPPSPQHRHRNYHRHHLPRSRKTRSVASQLSSLPTPDPPASPAHYHRHSDADLPSASLLESSTSSTSTSSSFSSSSSSSGLVARTQTIETNQVSTSYNENGQKQINQYVVEGGELGSGTSGEVKLVFSLYDNQPYAMKEVNKTKAKKKRLKRKDQQDMWEQLKREIAIMKKVDHTNVVRLVEVMDDPHNDRLYMVMEYVAQGHVGSSEMPEPIPLHLVKQYMRDVLCGLDYLHYHNIIHRDIKPDNLLLSATGECKIGDLGMSTVLSSTQELLHEYSSGTPAYRPPEMCMGMGFSGQAADVWSLGVTMYFLIYAQLPFWGSSEMLLAQSIIDKELIFPDDEEAQTVEAVDEGCKRFIARMLEKDPRGRVSVEEMLSDEWLTDSGHWHPDRSWREKEDVERRRKVREERRAARGVTGADDKEGRGEEPDSDDDDGAGDVSRPHEIIVTPAEVKSSITVVSQLLLMVKLKRKMRKHRRALAGSRARSVSLDDRMQDRHGHYVPQQQQQHSSNADKERERERGAANNGSAASPGSRWAAVLSNASTTASSSSSSSLSSPRAGVRNSRSEEEMTLNVSLAQQLRNGQPSSVLAKAAVSDEAGM